MNADQRARALVTPPGGKDAKDSNDLRAIGPNIRIEVQRQAKSDKAFALTDVQRSQHIAELKSLLERQQTAQNALKTEFTATRQELEQKKLPAEILARHDQAVRDFEQRAEQFNVISQKIQSNQLPAQADRAQAATKNIAGSDTSALQELSTFFAQYPNSKRHTPIDPGKLPWGSPKATPRMPAETKTAWHQQLTKDQKVQLAQAGNLSTVGGLQFSIPPEPTQAPQDADLAENDEIQLTPAIKAKALELGNNPVNIYNWVRNTIQWLPTWGSIQGAEGTLKTQRGNAFDTASLTIALLRASGIPARYQFGTVDIPAEQVMNWIGGVQKPEAALNLMYQGGIAATGLTQAGRFATIRMEHVWVNAYVNWTPSRGTKDGGWNLTPKQHVNPNANLNTWVPLDASFKQYTYTAGMNLQTAAPLDAAALIQAVQQGATVTPNYAQNLNQANLQSQLTSYQNQLKAYLNSTPTGASSTVGDVLGSQVIKTQTLPMLAGTLPYQTVVVGNERAALPDSLRWKWRMRLFADDYAQANDSPTLAIELPASQVAGKKVTLSFIPASQADADTIASYLPKAHTDGSLIQPVELPSSLPGYLIRMRAEIRLDGQLIAGKYTIDANPTAQSWQLGTDLASRAGFFNPVSQQWEDAELNRPVAGETIATAFDLQGIGSADMQSLKDRLNSTQTALLAFQANPNNAGAAAGLTKEALVGDLLYSAALGFFASVQTVQELAAKSTGQISNRLPSFGNFQTVISTQYSWGVPRRVIFAGLLMDIDKLAIQTSPKNWTDWPDEAQQRIGSLRQLGAMMSAYEHAMPEQLFGKDLSNSDPNAALQAKGYSAVRILALAAEQGQKIYTFTNQNQVNHALMLSQVNVDQAVKDEIVNAVSSGFEATIHENPIEENDFSGSGYTIIDPATGAGAWKVSGGGNGAIILGYIAITLAIVLFALAVAPLIVAAIQAIITWIINRYVISQGIALAEKLAQIVASNSPLVMGISYNNMVKDGLFGDRIIRFTQAYVSSIAQNPNVPANIRHIAASVMDLLTR